MPPASSRLAWSRAHQLALASALDQAIRCSANIVPRPSGTASAPEGDGHDLLHIDLVHQTLPSVAAALQLPPLAQHLAHVARDTNSLGADTLTPPDAHCLPPLTAPSLQALLEHLAALLDWLNQTLPTPEPDPDLDTPNPRRNRKTTRPADSSASNGSPTDESSTHGHTNDDWLTRLWGQLSPATPTDSDFSASPGTGPLPANTQHPSTQTRPLLARATEFAVACHEPEKSRHRPSNLASQLACPHLQAGLLARVTLLQERLLWTQRLEQEKLASLKRLAYGASHEINNPLANIATRAQTLLPGETNLQRRQTLQTINSQAFRAFDMLANLMHYAAPPRNRPQRVDLVPLVNRNCSALRRQLENPDQPIELQLPAETLLATVDPDQFGVLVQALLRNAVEAVAASPESTEIIVRLDSHTSPAGHTTVLLDVLDSGHSPAPTSLPFLCDPFYSGREAGRGLGFGLAKALRIVEAHGGHLTWHNRQPAGFHIRAILPQQP